MQSEIENLKYRVKQLETVNQIVVSVLKQAKLYVEHCADVHCSPNGFGDFPLIGIIAKALRADTSLKEFNYAVEEAVLEYEKFGPTPPQARKT